MLGTWAGEESRASETHDILKRLTHITGIRRKEWRKRAEAVLKEIMAKNFPKLKKNLRPQIQETVKENYKQDEHKTHLGGLPWWRSG